MKLICKNHNPLLLPGSPLEPSGAPLENKAELITLPIGNDNILQLLHHRAGAPAHQAQGSVIIWLCEFVLFCKPAMEYNKTKVKGVRLCMKPLNYITNSVHRGWTLTCGSFVHPASQLCSSSGDKCHLSQSCERTQTCF